MQLEHNQETDTSTLNAGKYRQHSLDSITELGRDRSLNQIKDPVETKRKSVSFCLELEVHVYPSRRRQSSITDELLTKQIVDSEGHKYNYYEAQRRGYFGVLKKVFGK